MTDSTLNADMFDFTNMEGVPSELADAVTKERTGRDQVLLSAVVQIATNAPMALSLKQVMVVLHKMNVTVPAETTVRSYLNAAHDDGLIGKPSRQSYWTVESNVEAETEVAAEAAAEVEAEDDDILGGLEA